MRLTPLDIRKQEFRKAMRGLDAEEVYAFLSTVGDEYEAILNDNKAFRERLLELDDKVQEYRSMEKNLRNTLLTAERVTVEAKDSARREANLIIKEAQIEADKSLRDIKNQAMKLRQEVSQLRGQRESYLGRMKVIAESLLKFIEGVETDFNEEDDAFQAALPEASAPQEALLADAPAENGDLFDDAIDETNNKDGSETTRADYRPAPGSMPDAPGIQREMKSRRAVESHGSRKTSAPPPADAPNPDRPQAGDYSPPIRAIGSTAPPPLERSNDIDLDVSPVAAENIPVSEYEPVSKLADIDAIIERMAAGQKEILSASRSAFREQAPDERTDRPHFEPIPPRATPLTTGPSGPEGTVKQKANDSPSIVVEAPYGRRTPAEVVLENEPEVATAIETPAEEVEPSFQGPATDDARRVPTGTDVTSEMSLAKIRRDLESQMSRDKGDKDR
jgi:cell division initiation protein